MEPQKSIWKDKFKRVWVWLRKNVLNKEMFLFVLIAEIVFWSPCIVTAVLAICISPLYWSICSAVIIFWAGPFTPAVPLQFGLAVLLKKLWRHIKKNGGKNE